MKVPKNVADYLLAHPEAKIGPSVRMPEPKCRRCNDAGWIVALGTPYDSEREPCPHCHPAPKKAAKSKPKRPRKDMADVLKEQCELAGLPVPERDIRLIAKRMWKWDAVWPKHPWPMVTLTGLNDAGLAVEVHGGLHAHQAHSTPEGITKDMEKRNALVLQGGYRQLDFSAGQVRSGYALKVIERVLRGAG